MTESQRREAQFRELDAEWAELLRRQAAREMDSWRVDMEQMIERHDTLVSEGKWLFGESDVLSIAGVARKEMPHTRMLAWLLDPRGRHRLGDAVLRRVLDHIETSARPVVRHVQVSDIRCGREADIVVYGRDFTLVIEVKVEADEQPKQCDDLYKNYRNDPGACFLFLTPSGRRPDTATGNKAKQAFKTASWCQIRQMIESALESRGRSSSGSATDVAPNYTFTLKEHFR